MFIRLNIKCLESSTSLSSRYIFPSFSLSSLPSIPYLISTFIPSFLSFHSKFSTPSSSLSLPPLPVHISRSMPPSLPLYPFLFLYCCSFHPIDFPSFSFTLDFLPFTLASMHFSLFPALSTLCLPHSHSLPSAHSIFIPSSFPSFYPYRSFFPFYLPSFLFSIPLSLSLSLSCSLFFQPSLNPFSLFLSPEFSIYL